MWLKRKTMKVNQLTPGMHIIVGFRLFKIRSIEDGGIFKELSLMSVDPKSSELAYLTLESNSEIHVNLKKK